MVALEKGDEVVFFEPTSKIARSYIARFGSGPYKVVVSQDRNQMVCIRLSLNIDLYLFALRLKRH